MPIVTTIAWRNVWRNGRRSAVLIAAVAVAVFSFVGSTAFMDGFGQDMISSAVELNGGHIQIAADGFHDNPTIDARIADAAPIAEALRRVPGARYAPQISASGMANSTEQAAGVVIRGIDPAREPVITSIASKMTSGRYLEDGDEGGVVIGQALADRLRVTVGEKIVLMVNDLSGEVSAGAYRITGLFRSGTTGFDRTQVYLLIGEMRRLLGYAPAEVSTIALRITDADAAETVAAELRGTVAPGLELLTWEDRNPLVGMAREAYDYSVLLMALILFTAVGFTLINSFLMVIMERMNEIGVLLAQGIPPAVIRRILTLEALFIALIGAAAGLVVSAVVIGYWMHQGLDLSAFADGLGQWGMSTVMVPVIDARHMLMGFAVIFLMVFLSVLYPAHKASRFDAVEALNHV